jgi:hypothetical protein
VLCLDRQRDVLDEVVLGQPAVFAGSEVVGGRLPQPALLAQLEAFLVASLPESRVGLQQSSMVDIGRAEAAPGA